MLFYYILFSLSAVWLILCIISAITENNPSERAKIRNFFRRIRISLREVTLFWTVVIVGLAVYIAAKSNETNWLWLGISLGIFLTGLIILEHFRIFGIAKAKKRKKLVPLTKIKK